MLTIPDPLGLSAGAGIRRRSSLPQTRFRFIPLAREYLMATALAVALNGLSPLAREYLVDRRTR
ncbi:hypothetical protein JRY29_07755 [Salmonella enterica subsp. enterica serovar Kentucky]|nr:hypothetical protein JRY29_07755 [Salmonella enterica subsp. enterica serovar Kentucky]